MFKKLLGKCLKEPNNNKLQSLLNKFKYAYHTENNILTKQELKLQICLSN